MNRAWQIRPWHIWAPPPPERRLPPLECIPSGTFLFLVSDPEKPQFWVFEGMTCEGCGRHVPLCCGDPLLWLCNACIEAEAA